MERWEYGIGTEGMDGSWIADTEGIETYEAANRALIRTMIESRNSDWLDDPHVLKRSERHPAWTPVYDHAAELLVEALEGVRLDFATIGAGIVQGSDVAKIFKKRAQILRNTLPNQSQEYDA